MITLVPVDIVCGLFYLNGIMMFSGVMYYIVFVLVNPFFYRPSKECYIPFVSEVAAFCSSGFSAFALFWSGALRWSGFSVS